MNLGRPIDLILIARSIAAKILRVLISIPPSIKICFNEICSNQIPEHRIKERKLHQKVQAKSTNKKHKSAKQTDE
ncbi:MAG: hypothetical protein BJG00_006615 [Limnothrix sp. CACIAM 69d]|nr:MAG: hypothetical protein BJG00_006615 [Limnothrix sp. CACIAM 69d]